MNNRHHLAILAGSAFFAVGLAGCDAGEQRDPGTTDQESTGMYEGGETGETGTGTMGGTTDDSQTGQQYGQSEPQPEDQGTSSFGQSQGQTEMGGQTGMGGMGSESEMQSQSQTQTDSLDTIGASEVVGKTVVSQQGEEIGSVEDVVTDQSSQQQLAVVDVGGFLGVGEKSVAVPFDQLELSEDGRIRSDLTRENLQAQPEYDPSMYESQSQQSEPM